MWWKINIKYTHNVEMKVSLDKMNYSIRSSAVLGMCYEWGGGREL